MESAEKAKCLGNVFRKMNSEMSEILPFLYLGNRLNASCEQQIRKNGIRRILAIHDRPPPPPSSYSSSSSNGFEGKHPLVAKYKFIQMSDTINAPICEVFEEAVQFIQEARESGENILVHCLMGQSRSATIVAAYVAAVHGLDGPTALQFVRQRRKQANPNVGFILQLSAFAKKMSGKNLDAPTNGNGGSKVTSSLMLNDRAVINKYCPFALPE